MVGIKNIKISPEKAIESLSNNKGKVVFEYNNGDFKAFILEKNSVAKVHSIQKRLGFWLIDYPYGKTISGIATIKNDLYFYNLYQDEKAESIFLKTENGEVIHPIKYEKIHLDDNSYLAYIFKIENYIKHKGNVQIVALDKEGSAINVESNEFDKMEISLSSITDNGNKLYTYSTEEIKNFNDDRGNLKEIFIETINNKKPIEPIVFDGSKFTSTQKDISSSTVLGQYIKIEGKDKVFTWDHSIAYHIRLNGEYKNILTKHEGTYFNHSLYKDGLASNVLYYKVTSSDELNKLFDLFFE